MTDKKKIKTVNGMWQVLFWCVFGKTLLTLKSHCNLGYDCTQMSVAAIGFHLSIPLLFVVHILSSSYSPYTANDSQQEMTWVKITGQKALSRQYCYHDSFFFFFLYVLNGYLVR